MIMKFSLVRRLLVTSAIMLTAALIAGVTPAAAGGPVPPPEGCVPTGISTCVLQDNNCVSTYSDAAIGDVWVLVDKTCSESSTPVGAALWLALVCEPLNGYSAAGQTTIDSDADEKGLPTTLYIGPSITGPWTPLEVNGPPWVLSEELMATLAASEGVASDDDLWFWVGSGVPMNFGSAVADRQASMDDLCGSEGAKLPGNLVIALAFVGLSANPLLKRFRT